MSNLLITIYKNLNKHIEGTIIEQMGFRILPLLII